MLPPTFRSLRHANYRRYFLGQIVSLTGTWVQTTALMWLARSLTNQSKWPALIMAAQVLPTFLLGVWGGALADRYPRRGLILTTQTGFLLVAVLLTLLVYSGAATPGLLLLLALLSGIVSAIDLPARLAFVIDLVGREDLPNAVALNSLIFNLARALGPALAGWLMDAYGAGLCFLLNTFSYAGVLLALAGMEPIPRLAPAAGAPPVTAGVLTTVLHDRRLLVLLVLTGCMSFFGWPATALLPGLADEVLRVDERGYGLLVSGVGFGALAAALTLATFHTQERRWSVLALGVGLTALALLGLSLAPTLAVALVAAALLGFGLILFFATAQAAVQLSTGEHNRGRVLGLWTMVLSGAQPLGNLLGGPAADLLGVPWVLRLQALGAGLSLGLLVVANRRHRDRPSP